MQAIILFMTKEEYTKLYEKFLAGNASAREEELIYKFKDEFDITQQEWDCDLLGNRKITKKRILQKLSNSINAPDKTKFLSMRQLYVAASVVILIGIAAFIFFNYNSNQKTIAFTSKPDPSDILPGSNKAVLTLSNGSRLLLDSLQNGTISKQGNITVTKKDGHISYQNKDDIAEAVLYNTLTIPRGGQYHLTLQDGTMVWLNASSTLRFPVSFSNQIREVELTGEAYFEVAHINNNGNKVPFIVHVKSEVPQKNMDVQVLGTHFNIMAYNDDDVVAATLLEGSVKVIRPDASVLLKPGEQAALKNDASLMQVKKVDVDNVVAWKNGKFLFDKADIPVVMRQLSRWYDVDVEYKGEVPKQQFWGGIERDLPLSSVLAILKESNLKFEVEGKKIIVSE